MNLLLPSRAELIATSTAAVATASLLLFSDDMVTLLYNRAGTLCVYVPLADGGTARARQYSIALMMRAADNTAAAAGSTATTRWRALVGLFDLNLRRTIFVCHFRMLEQTKMGKRK